ncbi:MAG TPA: hypothetical protein VFI02_08445, partial [Armatimonadota bacterium]|nr:hypothetical protein [Armatimonadota bacterium]
MIPGLKEVLEDATGRLVAAQYSDRDFQGLPADHPSRFMKGQISKLSDQAESGTGGTGTLMLGSRHRTGTTLVSLKALLRARRLGAGTLQLTRHYLSTVRSEGFWVTVDRQVDVPGRTEIRTVANYRHTIPIAWLSLYLAP